MKKKIKNIFKFQWAFLIVLVLISTGCAIGPRYKKPVIDAPTEFRGQEEQAPDNQSIADLPWWKIFDDGTLNQLVEISLKNNYDVRIAATRIKQSRAIQHATRSLLFPTADFQFGLGRGRNAMFDQPSYNSGKTTTALLLGLNTAWEIDLWGRVRRMNEAAKAEYFASEWAHRGVMLSLVSSVAQSYFELLELDLELKITKRTVQSFKESLDIFERRLAGGVASKLETSRARASWASTKAAIPDLERQIESKENQIRVLLGENPGPIKRNLSLLQVQTPPLVPAGIPSALLERRPDILEAEQMLRSANAQVGVAMGNFLPQVGLTMVLGKVSPELSVITGGMSNFWSLAGSVLAPIFQAGRLIAQYQEAKAQWEEAKLTYEQTALTAFQEVSDALIKRQKLKEIRIQQAVAVKSLQEAVYISMERYLAGKASYYEVLEAQQQLYPAETDLAQTELNQYLVIVELYKTLGGGWNLKDKDWQPQAA